eukprot:gene3509-6157_t
MSESVPETPTVGKTKKRKLSLKDTKKKKNKKEKLQESYQKIILDIEGTTTPITFVHYVLFPYVRNNVKVFLEKTFDTKQTTEDVEKIKSQAKEDLDSTDHKEAPQIDSKEKTEIIEQVVSNIFWNMDKDRKMAALKSLQGHIWEEAYQQGEIKGIVYKDVVKALKRWKKQSKEVYIYSSGSVYAQKLLFGHSDNEKEPDLLKYIKGHYDTVHPGSKLEVSSYETILKEISSEKKTRSTNSGILFVTDNILEAEASKKAGIVTVLSVREGNKELPEDHGFLEVYNYDQL